MPEGFSKPLPDGTHYIRGRGFLRYCRKCQTAMYRIKYSEARRENWNFCSRSCTTAASNSRVRIAEYVSKVCRNCEKIFRVRALKRQMTYKYCSRNCALAHKNREFNYAKDPEVKRKLSRAAKMRGTAHMHTPAARAKLSRTISGSGHWNWQGGKTQELVRLRNSTQYKEWRMTVFRRDRFTCVLCGYTPGRFDRSSLNADHIKQFAHYPERRFDVDNGRTLCIPCHQATDTFGSKGPHKTV